MSLHRYACFVDSWIKPSFWWLSLTSDSYFRCNFTKSLQTKDRLLVINPLRLSITVSLHSLCVTMEKADCWWEVIKQRTLFFFLPRFDYYRSLSVWTLFYFCHLSLSAIDFFFFPLLLTVYSEQHLSSISLSEHQQWKSRV